MLKACGAFHLMQRSNWRRQRLLILCYHGISLADEHEWRPYLYIRAEQLERSLEILRKGKYSVLPLGEAVERLYRNDLPPRSVALTFDDGTYDFYRQAYPRIKQAGFPVTVYLTTYYSEHPLPVFSLICSYMMWKARDRGTVNLSEMGVSHLVDIGSPEQRYEAVNQLVRWADAQDISGEQKNQIAARLAQLLRIDYQEIVEPRIPASCSFCLLSSTLELKAFKRAVA